MEMVASCHVRRPSRRFAWFGCLACSCTTGVPRVCAHARLFRVLVTIGMARRGGLVLWARIGTGVRPKKMFVRSVCAVASLSTVVVSMGVHFSYGLLAQWCSHALLKPLSPASFDESTRFAASYQKGVVVFAARAQRRCSHASCAQWIRFGRRSAWLQTLARVAVASFAL